MWASLRLTCGSLAGPRASAAHRCLQAARAPAIAMASTAAGGGGGAAAGGTVAADPSPPAQQQQQQAQGRVRSYPDEPRVGVGVVILRQLSPQQPEVLLIRRAKEPSKGRLLG